jgi:heme-degrading monooxygenase HmoA
MLSRTRARRARRQSGRNDLRCRNATDDSNVLTWTRRRMMFIAMNRFRVKRGSEEAFEQVWLSRDTQLTKVPGFVEFHLLKGPEHEDYTLYSSHTVWQSKATFEAWTKSEAFRLAHRDAGQNKPLYLDHPQLEGFEVRQTVRRGEDAVA